MTKEDLQTTSTGCRDWSSRQRWIWLVIVIMALALRAGIAHREASTGEFPVWFPDTRSYVNTAINIADHGISSSEATESPRPNAGRTPGYPLFLLIFYKITGTVGAAVAWGQIAIDLMVLVLLGLIAKELFGARAALVAMGAYALDLGAAMYSTALLSETLSAFVLILTFLCLRRALDSGDKRWHFLTGALLGLAILVRPFFLLIPPALLLAWGLNGSRRRRWKEAICLVVGLVVVVGPWSARSMVLWGTPQISSIGGTAAWVYHAGSLRSKREGLPLPTAFQQCRDEAAPLLRPGPENAFANSRVMFRLAMQELAQTPLLTAALWAKGMMRTLLDPNRGLQMQLWPDSAPARGWVALAVLWFVTVSLAAIGLFKALRARSTPVWYLVGLIAITLFTAGIIGYARFRVPVVWAICILAGAAVMNGVARKPKAD